MYTTKEDYIKAIKVLYEKLRICNDKKEEKLINQQIKEYLSYIKQLS